MFMVLTVLLAGAASNASAQTLESATISNGGGVLADGSILVIGQPVVGTMSNAEFTIEVGIVPTLASACPSSSAPQIEQLVSAGGGEVDSVKNRYLSFTAGNAGQQQAIRIRMLTAPTGFEGWVGATFWVGVPTEVSELGGKSDNTPPTFQKSDVECVLGDEMFLGDWASRGTIHVAGPQIVPGATYEITVVNKSCNPTSPDSFPAESSVQVATSRWGDAVGNFNGDEQTWEAPNGSVDVGGDVVAILDKFKSAQTAPIKSRADIQPAAVDNKVDILDVTVALDAFAGVSFPFAPANPTTPCP